jgi:Fe-S cluster biogenesis protein NfuA
MLNGNVFDFLVLPPRRCALVLFSYAQLIVVIMASHTVCCQARNSYLHILMQKADGVEWHVLKPEVYAAIMDHYTLGKPLFTDADCASATDTTIREDDSDVVAMIKELLETRIKPAVAEDGGDIAFVGFEEETGRVTLKMQGACAGCPSSASTLKGGIEQMMRHYIPEVLEVVEAEPDELEAAGIKQFNKLEQHLSN